MTNTLTPSEPTTPAVLQVGKDLCALAPNSLKFREGTTLPQWRGVLDSLVTGHNALAWYLGDALNYGIKHFNLTARELAEQSRYSEGHLWNCAWVCSNIPPSRRRTSLSFSIHQEVASLKDVAEQEKFLDHAEQKALTRVELRVAIRKHKAISGAMPPQKVVNLPLNNLRTFNRHLEEIEAINEHRLLEAILQETQPIVDLHRRLECRLQGQASV